MIRNIEKSKVLSLVDELETKPGQVISKTLAKDGRLNLTLFAFDEGEGLASHTASGDAMVQVLAGSVLIVIDEKEHRLSAGDTIVMPANVPHSLTALTPFKMLLAIVYE